MKKIYILQGLDCPHCAGVIEKEVCKLEGVNASSVNLVKQTLTVETDFPSRALEEQIKAIVHRHEPEVTVSAYTEKAAIVKDKHHHHYESGNGNMIIRLISGGAFFAAGIILSAFCDLPLPAELSLLIISYLILGWDVVFQAARNIIKGHIFDENFLMTLSTIGAFAIGEYPEAVAVMLFYQIGEFFQALSIKRSRKSIANLMDIRPDSATVSQDGQLLTVSPESVRVGQIIVVKPGERIPLDGTVLEGESMLDTKALTGESLPKTVNPGDSVLSGCINQNGVLTIQVTKTFAQSTASKIIDLVENASSRKAPTENFITTFARYYTPVVVVLAAILAFLPPLLVGDWIGWIRRGMVFLVISCPCALVISIPLAFFGGIGAASRHGILVKGSNYLEALNKVRTVVFDKTGTLTMGNFQVSRIDCAEGFTQGQVLGYAAKAESFSNHPIAGSILAAYGKEINQSTISDYKELSGYGIQAVVDGRTVTIGNAKLMAEENLPYTPSDQVGTKVYIAIDRQYAGCIVIADEVKTDSQRAISELKKLGIHKTVMLTGDDETIGKAVAEALGLDEYHAQLLPQQKVALLEQLDSRKPAGSKLAFLGDGINDAPVLARADVGIAMGGLGSDAAIEAADVVLMTDEPSKLAEAIQIAKATRRIVIQNILFSLGVKVLFLLLGALGIAGMWEAVFADVGVALIAVLNAMRIIRK